MADYQQNFLSSLASGLQIGQQIKQQRDTSQINRLAGLAYGADPGQRESFIGQMHQINPTMAAEQEKSMAMTDERRQKGLVNAARILVNTPEQFRAGQYARMVPGLSQYGLSSLPPEYNAETSDLIMQTAQGLVSAADGAGAASDLKSFNAYTQGLSPEDVAKARRIKLGLDPRAVTGAMRFDTFTDANGNPRPQRNNPTTGQVEIYVDETGQWQPLGGGQPAQSVPQPGTYGTPSGVVRIGDLTPEQWELAQADIASGGTLENVTLPPRNVSPAQFSATGLGRGRRKEDETRAIEQAKADVQLRNLPAELNLRNDAAVRQTREQELVKQDVERTGAQAKKTRDADEVIGLIDEAEQLLGGASGGAAAAIGNMVAGSVGYGTEGAAANAALKTIGGQLTSKMPRMEGPQSNVDVRLYEQMAGDVANEYLPVSVRLAAIKQVRRLNQKYSSNPSGGQAGPAAGAIEDGYRFKGGNPADPNNWERL